MSFPLDTLYFNSFSVAVQPLHCLRQFFVDISQLFRFSWERCLAEHFWHLPQRSWKS